jgi:DNA invertase Pin-like site-specific DNA recombinase
MDKEKCGIYIRVSTRNQRDSLEDSVQHLERYCKREGFLVEGVYKEVVSGAKRTVERKEFSRLVKDIEGGKIKTVVTSKLDRFSRSLQDLQEMLSFFKEHRVEFVCSDQAIDTRTPAGKFLFDIMGAMAEFERELIKERTQAGIERAKAEGKTLGRPRVDIKMDRVKELLDKGLSLAEISNTFKTSYVTLHNRMKEEGLKVAKVVKKE